MLERVGNKMSENGSDKNKEMERVLLEVITTLQDGQKGFADIGEHLKDDTVKRCIAPGPISRPSLAAAITRCWSRLSPVKIRPRRPTKTPWNRICRCP